MCEVLDSICLVFNNDTDEVARLQTEVLTEAVESERDRDRKAEEQIKLITTFVNAERDKMKTEVKTLFLNNNNYITTFKKHKNISCNAKEKLKLDEKLLKSRTYSDIKKYLYFGLTYSKTNNKKT